MPSDSSLLSRFDICTFIRQLQASSAKSTTLRVANCNVFTATVAHLSWIYHFARCTNHVLQPTAGTLTHFYITQFSENCRPGLRKVDETQTAVSTESLSNREVFVLGEILHQFSKSWNCVRFFEKVNCTSSIGGSGHDDFRSVYQALSASLQVEACAISLHRPSDEKTLAVAVHFKESKAQTSIREIRGSLALVFGLSQFLPGIQILFR